MSNVDSLYILSDRPWGASLKMLRSPCRAQGLHSLALAQTRSESRFAPRTVPAGHPRSLLCKRAGARSANVVRGRPAPACVVGYPSALTGPLICLHGRVASGARKRAARTTWKRMTLAPLYHLWSQRPRRRRPRAALQEGTARALARRGEPQVSAAGRGGRGAHAASTSPRGRVTRSQGR